jgi:peptidoglycan-associated lipoprotein
MFVRTMIRSTMLVALLVTVSACSNKKDATGDLTLESTETTTMPADAGYGAMAVDGPVPGTQQDLVVNVGDRVFFGYDQHDLTPEGQRTLEMQAEWMKRYPNVNVTIEGHCDERGTREYNLALGERRAAAVKNYLSALGVPASRVMTISYGKERPAVMGSNPSAWSQNRRGVTVVN